MRESCLVQWVSPEWLHHRLGSEPMTIIDAQPEVHDYILEHIPGAVHLSDKVWRCSCSKLPACYLPEDAVEAILRRIGVNGGEVTVVYSGYGRFTKWGDGLEPTMVAYSLARFGHRKVCIVDGGLERWKDEGRPLTKEYPSIEPGQFECEVQRDFFVTYSEFLELKDRPDVTVFDVRPPAVYREKGIWGKPGHIPGAANLPWREFMDHQNAFLLKPLRELRELVESRHADRNKTVIVYCGTGREATNAFIILKWVLQFPKVRIYEGSYTEWVSYPENQSVSGPDPWG